MKNNKKRFNVVALVTTCLLVVVGACSLALSSVRLAVASDADAKDAIRFGLVSYLANHPDSQIAVFLARDLVGDTGVGLLGGTLNNDENSSNFNCVGKKDDDSSTHRVDCFATAAFPGTGSIVPYLSILKNQVSPGSKSPIYIDNVENIFVGTTTSTFRYAIFATNTAVASIYYAMSLLPANIAGATGTAMYETVVTSTQLSSTIHETVDGTAALYASSTVAVPWNWDLVVGIQNPYVAGCTNAYGCNVTSTERGWTGKIYVKFHYFKDF